MAQQKMLLGHVKGEPGERGTDGRNGVDAKITSATGTVTPGHLDEPTVSIEFGGEPGAQTATFTFAGLQGAKGEDGKQGADGPAGAAGPAGPAGPAGAAAGFGTITVTVDRSSEGDPSCEASWSGDDTSKDLTLAFKNLKGDRGDAGSDYEPQGTQSQILLGDGTAKDISTFISENAEAIREAIGLATTERMGLVPQLPQVEG